VYAAGATVAELAERYGLRPPTIDSILQRHARHGRRTGRPRKAAPQQPSKLLEEAKPTTKAAVQERINELSARVDAFVASVTQPGSVPSEPVQSDPVPAEPTLESKPDPNAGLDPKNPAPWPSEVEWMNRHWPKGVTPEIANRLTECYFFLLRYGVERGSDVYFELLERRMGIYKPPTRRTK
jgi:hypothetical protein